MNPYDLSDRKFRRNKGYDCGVSEDIGANEIRKVLRRAKQQTAKYPEWERKLHKWNDEILKKLQREG